MSLRQWAEIQALLPGEGVDGSVSPGRDRPSPAPAAKVKTQSLTATGTRHWEAGRRAEAIATFREAARLDPGSADTHHNLGFALFASGHLREAADSLHRAVELRPSFEKALRPLANALEHLGQEREAALAYRRLSRMVHDAVERRLFSAKALTLDGKLEEAETELRRALAVAPENAGARVLLGQLLLEQGSFEEAKPHLVRAIEVFPDVFQHLAAARRMTEADRPLVERVRELAGRADLNPIQRGAVHFGLGKAFNDLQDYAEAMQHYEAGNRLNSMSSGMNRAGHAAHYNSLIADYSAEEFERRASRRPKSAGADDDLPVFVLGMPRSGTTLVEQILSSHPSVAAGGELSFWSDTVKQWLADPVETVAGGETIGPIPPLLPPGALEGKPGLGAERASAWLPSRLGLVDANALSDAAEDYLALLRTIGPQALRVIDKAPFNFERLGPIRLGLPGARIIHCRRHPVDTCLSIFFTNFKGRKAWSRADLVFEYRQYERLMDHWRRVLPEDRFIEVEYETLIADREAQTRRLIAFCGLEWNDACLAPERNERMVKSASLWQARQPVYKTSLERWRRYEPWLGELRQLSPAKETDP